MDLRTANEIHREMVLVENGEDLCEKAMCSCPTVTVDIQNYDGWLDSDRSWPSALVHFTQISRRTAARKLGLDGLTNAHWFWNDHGSLRLRIHDVLDPRDTLVARLHRYLSLPTELGSTQS